MIQGSINSLLGMASGAIKGGKAMMAKGTEQPTAQPAAPEPAAQPAAQSAAPEPAAQTPAAPEPVAPEPAAQPAAQSVAPEPTVKAAPSPVDRVNKARKSAAQALSIEQDRLRRSQANAAIREGGVNSWQRGMGQLSMI